MRFESTLPFGEPDLMRVSAFQRYLAERAAQPGPVDAGLSASASLSPSLMQDLIRFEQDGRQTELLEVVAACIRHARNIAIHLQCDDRVLPLTVFPMEQMAHCPMSIEDLEGLRLAELQVLHVERAVLRPPGDAERALVGEPHLYHPLAQLTWLLALRGSREELLPEIAGPAAFRVAPSVNIDDLGLTGALHAAVRRLQNETVSLRSLSEWPGFSRGRASRLLNALYLQSGLIISRTHPAAMQDSWFGV